MLKKKLSVRQAEKFVQIFKRKKQKIPNFKDINITNLETAITEKIGLNVIIQNKNNNNGRIILEYKGLDQLNKIIDIIKTNY